MKRTLVVGLFIGVGVQFGGGHVLMDGASTKKNKPGCWPYRDHAQCVELLCLDAVDWPEEVFFLQPRTDRFQPEPSENECR